MKDAQSLRIHYLLLRAVERAGKVFDNKHRFLHVHAWHIRMRMLPSELPCYSGR
jgi:hypothetical protein